MAQPEYEPVDREAPARSRKTESGRDQREERRTKIADVAQSVEEQIGLTDPRGTETMGESGELDADTVFLILRNRRRRDALRYLRRHGGTLTHGELAEFIAAAENGKSVAELTSKERKRIYVSLYQSHLPMMAKEGVVEFERTGGTVELTERAAQLEKYLDGVHDDEPKWWNYYLGLAVFGGVFYGAVSFVFGRDNWRSVLTVASLVLATGAPALTRRNRLQSSEYDLPEPTEET